MKNINQQLQLILNMSNHQQIWQYNMKIYLIKLVKFLGF